MKKTDTPIQRCLSALIATLIGGSALQAQTITNPSFEADTYHDFPGYSTQAGNGPITGWTSDFPGSVGLNYAGNSPFADNGTYPNGGQVAFLQSAGGTNLRTTITGLTAGVTYKVNFRANARNGNSPLLRVSTDGIGETVESRIWSVGGSNPYRYVGYNFTATAASNVLTITNNQGGDNTLVVDDFSVTPSNSWSFSPWTDDASSGINPNFCYTHAYTLGGSAVPTVLNGVGFMVAPGGNPAVGEDYALTGLPNPFGDVARNLSGASNAVGKSFIYGGPDMSITLKGLKPNTAYVATIYGVNFDGNGGDRTANFSSSLNPTDALTVNLDHYGASNGIRVNYAYTTDATGTVTINYQQTADASWHTSAFANREAAPISNWTRNHWNDDATSGVDGTDVGSYTHAYSFGSSDSTVINGVTFTGVGGGNPSVGGSFSTNFPNTFANDANNITGNSATLAKDFVYGGNPAIFQLTGLTPGESYQMTIFSVGWEGNDGVRTQAFSGDAGTLIDDQDRNGDNNGIRFDYRYIADGGGNAQVFVKPTIGTNTLHCYGFCNRHIATIPTPVTTWTRKPWTNDSTSGVDSAGTYTHAYNFGSGDNPTINGIAFTGVGGGNPSASNFSLSNCNGVFTNDANNLTGGGDGSALLAKDFVYNGNPAILNLSGLTPGSVYDLTIFSMGWEPIGRYQTFSGANGALVADQDTYGDNNGIRFDYQYVADGAGRATVLVTPSAGTLHWYGFCNRLVPAPGSVPAWTYSAWNGDPTSGLTTAGVYTHAYNLASADNLTINGVGITGVGGANPGGVNWFTENFGASFLGFSNNVGDPGNSNKMATDFVYNGFPGGLVISGLTAGKEYLLSLYLVGFGNPGQRQLMLNGQAGCLPADENAYGSGNGMRADYHYTANALGRAHVTFSPQGSGSLHLHGFANREAALLPTAPAKITLQPVGGAAGLGKSFTFNVGVTGTPTISYQWRFNGTDILGATSPTYTVSNITFANEGNYSVYVANIFGNDTSINAFLDVRDSVAGLFDTGMGANCALLAGGANDPHYQLLVNADGTNGIQAIVASVLPSPPWVLNTATSKWIGPRADTSGAAGHNGDGGAGLGVYIYRTTVDLTGFTLPSVIIRGQYAVDNFGLNIRVNGADTGITNNQGFANYSSFTLNSSNSSFVSGVNTIDFIVENTDVGPGYTGLRVSGLEGIGDIPPGTAPHIAVQPASTTVARYGDVCLTVSANGTIDLTYQWYHNGLLIPGATGVMYNTTANSGDVIGNYTVTVTNGFGTTTSEIAVVSIQNNAPVAHEDGTAITKDTQAVFDIATLLANDTDADGDVLTITAFSATSAQGGTVEFIDPVVIYTPPPGFTGLDSFTYTVSDGWGGVSTTFVRILVLAGPVPACGQVIYDSATPQKITVGVLPGASYTFQRSTDLLIWEDLSTTVAPVTGVLQLSDPSPMVGRRFYRVKKVP